MHRVLGKVAIGLGDGDGAIEKIEALYPIGYVNQSGPGLDTTNNPFHCTNIVLGRAKVGRKGDHPLCGHINLRCRKANGEVTVSTVTKSSLACKGQFPETGNSRTWQLFFETFCLFASHHTGRVSRCRRWRSGMATTTKGNGYVKQYGIAPREDLGSAFPWFVISHCRRGARSPGHV